MSDATQLRSPREWRLPLAVFVGVFVPQVVLVALAGTDIPFHDQWNIEGQWLYPAWRDGTLTLAGLLQPFNEHRILWTHLLNLGLLVANGQWDPLVQMVAIAVLRAGCAAGLAWQVAKGTTGLARFAVAAGVTLAFLPLLAWHNVLWGIESHAYFSLGLGLITLVLLGSESVKAARAMGGLAVGIAGLFAMGPNGLVPVVLLGLASLRAIEQRRVRPEAMVALWPVVILFGLAVVLRTHVPTHAALQARGAGEFLAVAGRVLSWPHGTGGLAALLLNAPLVALVVLRALQKRSAAHGEDFVVLVGGWGALLGLGTAWMRGGSPEMAGGLPSRYVDFVVLLPLANAWCAVVLAGELAKRGKTVARVVAGAWGAFLLLGWLGLSAEVIRGLVLPRARDREAPVRLMRAYQTSGDAAVFSGQPLLLVPHPNLESVRAVLEDPRLRGALPPSLQPDERPGALSRAARGLLGHPHP